MADGGGDEEVLKTFLAGHTGIVPRDVAASILTEWSRAPKLHLTDLLRNVGGLDDGALDALTRLASVHYEAHGRDLSRSLAACWDVQTLRDEERTEADPLMTVAAACSASSAPTGVSLPLLPLGPPPRDEPKASHPSSAPPPRARYERLHVHAKGGIGRVWKARDRQLDREVAIKEIQPDKADREDLRIRFMLEAEITGKLEHPGIVPVYSLGEDEAGRPYYAMRFVQGDSLGAAIRTFHKARKAAEVAGADPSEAWGVDFRQLLMRFLGACETLEYAHSKGYIHRDLKPGNIMVGPYGETLVVDWGLAKVVGSGPEPRMPPGPGGDLQHTPTSGTSPGDRLGTPHYMSPEQTIGALDRIGPRSDVYSLGATLHELLTGEVPFNGVDPHTVAVAVLQGVVPPRATLPSIPAPLESICLKAMAFKAEDRYASAAALARDVERWLADEPVSVHPEGRREQAARWVRRHRTWTLAAATVLVGLSLVATTAALLINRSRRGELEARAQAEQNFELAQKAVDDYLVRVSQDKLLAQEDSVDLRRLRRALLQTALDYYLEFVAKRGDDPKLRRALAKAHHNVGVIQSAIASPSDAVGPLKSALGGWDELLSRSPGDHELAADRAATLTRLGKVLNDQGRPGDALEALKLAAAAFEPLSRRPGANATERRALADCLSSIAAIQAARGLSRESLEASGRARAILEELLAEVPGSAYYREALAETANNQGYALAKVGDYHAALRSYEECRDVALAMLHTPPRDDPSPIRSMELAALGASNVGDMLLRIGKPAAAEASYLQSLQLRRELATAHRTVHRFRLQFGQAYRSLGSLQHQLGKDAEAIRSLMQSREELEGLLALAPEHPQARFALARTLNTLGCLHDDRGEHREAVAPLGRSAEEYRRAIAGGADGLDYRFHLAGSLGNLAEQYADLGEIDRAVPAWDEAAKAALDVLRSEAAGPAQFAVCVDLASTSAEVRLQAGDPAGALARFEEVAEAARSTRAAPAAPARESALRILTARRAACLLVAGRTADAAALLDGLEAGGQATPDPAATSEIHWLRARAARLRELGDDAAAAEAARLSLWKPGDADRLFAKASGAARRACLVGDGRSPLPAAGEEARTLDAEQAADDLRLARTLGFADRARVEGDRALMTVLERPYSHDLRDEFAPPAPPVGPAP